MSLSPRQLFRAICLALAGITLLVYLPLLGHGFVDYDDPDYITSNAHVRAGITWDGIVWAFTSTDASNWHPLTWISHMLDCQLFGFHAAGHHLVNVLFHTANTVLLFLLLNRLTGALWRSALVAALFAWHPMHVESVAWASERKDVLSAFFWMLTLLAYARFTRGAERGAPGPEHSGSHPPSAIFYLLALLSFACGLMSKPMVVTLPFVLLLLDFWPIHRVQGSTFKVLSRLIVEKIPFFLLSLGSCLVTYRAQHAAFWSPDSLPLPLRLMNVLMAYVRYISKLLWPTDLALIYPYPHFWPMPVVVIVTVVLLLLTTVFVLQAKRFPYLVIGWFWFLGTLVPAIGLVQVGVQSMADRYSYLPSIGLFIFVVWGLNDLLARSPRPEKIGGALAAIALVACLALASVQINHWRNSVAIFWHTVKVTTDNYAALDCLGRALENIGKPDQALEAYTQAINAEPRYPSAQFDLGMLLVERNRPDEASNHIAIAVRLEPQNPVMQFDYGVFLFQHGNTNAAAEHFRRAIEERPDLRDQVEKVMHPSTTTTNPPAR